MKRLIDLKEETEAGRKPAFTDTGRFQMRLPDELQPELEAMARRISVSKAVLVRRTVKALLAGEAVQWT